MHDDPPPIVFEPRMKGTKKAIDIHEANNICWAKDAALNRGAFCDSIEIGRCCGNRRSRESSPIIRALSSSLISFSRRNHPRREHPGCSLPFFSRSVLSSPFSLRLIPPSEEWQLGKRRDWNGEQYLGVQSMLSIRPVMAHRTDSSFNGGGGEGEESDRRELLQLSSALD